MVVLFWKSVVSVCVHYVSQLLRVIILSDLFYPLSSSISLSRSPLEQLEAEKEEREQKLKKMQQEMEQVFEMKVKEKKKKLKDSEAEVSGRVDVKFIGFTLVESFCSFATRQSYEFNLVLPLGCRLKISLQTCSLPQ